MTRRRKGKPEPASREQLDRLKEKFRRIAIGTHHKTAAEDAPRRKWRGRKPKSEGK